MGEAVFALPSGHQSVHGVRVANESQRARGQRRLRENTGARTRTRKPIELDNLVLIACGEKGNRQWQWLRRAQTGTTLTAHNGARRCRAQRCASHSLCETEQEKS